MDSGVIWFRFVPDSMRYYYRTRLFVGGTNIIFHFNWSGHFKILNDYQIQLNDCPNYSESPVPMNLYLSGTFNYYFENGHWIIEQTDKNPTFKFDLTNVKPDILNLSYPNNVFCGYN